MASRRFWKQEEDGPLPVGSSMSLAELSRKNPPNGVPMSLSTSYPSLAPRTAAKQQDTSAPIGQSPPILSTAPRVTIVEGKLVVDEESLVLDRPSLIGADTRERVEETSKWTTSASFRKTSPRNRWSAEDTEHFYQALRTYGTDFEMIAQALKNRTRAQVKNKFKREERENPVLVSAALLRRS